MKRSQDFRRVFADRYQEAIPLDEYERACAYDISDDEVAELMDLVRWFRTRYPTVQQRFAYIRRKHAEWTR